MYPRYNLRSNPHGFPPRGDAPPLPVAPGYQPPPRSDPSTFQHHPKYVPMQNTEAFSPLETEIDTVPAALDSLLPIIQGAAPKSPFETSVQNVMQVLIGQVKAINQKVDRNRNATCGCLRQMDNSMVDVTRGLVKTEQYNRRDTITVTGLQKESTETEDTLAQKVAETLSVSGEDVAVKDFTAVHRNGQKPRKIAGKEIPPSVTVKFHNISKKDRVLRN